MRKPTILIFEGDADFYINGESVGKAHMNLRA